MDTRTVVVVAFPGVQTLDVAGPVEVFAGATRVVAGGRDDRVPGAAPDPPSPTGPPAYDVRVVSALGGTVRGESGLGLATDPLTSAPDRVDTLVLAGGDGVHAACGDGALVSWVAAAAPRSRRVATVCTGTFLAGAAGLLEGRRVTTHWARAGRLARTHPGVVVDPGPLYVRDGGLWSSAGVTAGIDLSLALVEDDHGPAVARTVARWLVMFLHRPGGQAQFSGPVWSPLGEREAVRAVQAAVTARPADDHRLPVLAEAASMSVRHFSRLFTAEVGMPPGRFVEEVRIRAARSDLETTGDTLDVVARRCGLGSAETLRRVFHRHLGTTPDAYRRRFRTGDPAPPTP